MTTKQASTIGYTKALLKGMSTCYFCRVL